MNPTNKTRNRWCLRTSPLVATIVLPAAFVALQTSAAYAQNPATTITVNATSARHPINPQIYGVAFASSSDLKDLNVPLNRSGGNAATQYNWLQNASNRAADWFFESLPEAGSNPGQWADEFITASKNGGAQPMITIPMVGYVAKLGPNRSALAAFSVSKYGAQQNTDYWFSDAGNGVKPDGVTLVTGNDPNDADVPADSTFQQNWVRHLVSTFGTSAKGGVKYYLYDNESGIWQSTHRNVHPVGPTMEEIRNKIIDYGNKIRAVDPGALLLGPEEWGWSGYLFSGYDLQYAGAHNWSSFPDRAAHGGMDYMPWLLDQLHQYETVNHKRLLDVFTLHYYPQGGEFGDDTSTAMQLRRNRSTRSLWDPNYRDETWINDYIKLIPRMHSWVTQYYPATPIGITEYNFGAENHINGATAQADVLGIFGRESLDLATRWTTPAPTTPTFKAIQMYRNYDGKKSTFGDTSVGTTVANPDNLAAFAATRSTTGTITVMAVCKYLTGATPTTVSLANFKAGGPAQVYQLTATNAITRLTDLPLTNNALKTNLPAQSVTLFVIPAQPAFTMTAVASPNTVTLGKATRLTLSVTNKGGALSSSIVDVEIFNSSGTRVYQQAITGQNFAYNQSRPYLISWTPSTVGTYTVKIGIFDSTWNTLYQWNNGAATVTAK